MLARWGTGSTFDAVFDDVMRATLGYATSSARFQPTADIRAREHEFVFSIDVPGVKLEDLDITLENRLLTIKGARQADVSENERVTLGRPYGAFSLSYTLPDSANGEQLAAELADGVLTLRVPKHPKTQPRKITIGGT